MQIAISDEDISEFMDVIQRYAQEHPILIDKYLMGVEVEVDAVCDGEEIVIPGIMQDVERAESILETVFPYILQETFLLRLKRLSDIIQSYWQRLYTLSVLSISSSLYIRMKYMSLRLTLVLQEPFLISVR